jgi:hypothetical protein
MYSGSNYSNGSNSDLVKSNGNGNGTSGIGAKSGLDEKGVHQLIDRVILLLGVPQKSLKPLKYEIPDLKTYPIEFDYLTRCLHSLGDNYAGLKIEDSTQASLLNAISYAITGNKAVRIKEADQLENKTAEEICQLLKINILMVLPHNVNRKIIYGTGTGTEASGDSPPFAIIYRSLDNRYYPMITLEKRTNYLFCKERNKFLQLLLEEPVNQ